MQELPHGGTAALAGHAGVTALGRFVEAADQGRQHMAVGGMEDLIPYKLYRIKDA